jgi:hypothetical protein
MILSRSLRDVEAIYREGDLDQFEFYWFTYRNMQGEIIHAFRDRLLIMLDVNREIFFYDVVETSLNVSDAKLAFGCSIKIRGLFGEINLTIDTLSKGQFLDVFPIHKAISRQIYIIKHEINNGE